MILLIGELTKSPNWTNLTVECFVNEALSLPNGVEGLMPRAELEVVRGTPEVGEGYVKARP